MSSANIAKRAAGKAAAELIQDGMLVGLGTGSTAAFFIEELVLRRLSITAVSTSNATNVLALKHGIPLRNIDEISRIDITVDGADEVDPQLRMIKGGGGAHLREKIVASMSDQMVVVIDSSKEVSRLGKFPLPVEIVSFAPRATIQHIEDQGFKGTLRKTDFGNFYITDNGNYIYDIHLHDPNPEETDKKLRQIPGVVETGFFFNLASQVIVGYPDGHVEVRS